MFIEVVKKIIVFNLSNQSISVITFIKSKLNNLCGFKIIEQKSFSNIVGSFKIDNNPLVLEKDCSN